MSLVAHKYMVDEMPEEELRSTFAARWHTLDYLVDSIRNQNDAKTLTSYLITGARGAGKTTIVRMLCLRIQEDEVLNARWLPVRFPEELPGVVTLRDLLSAALERLAEQSVAGAEDAHARVEAEADDEQSRELAVAALQRISEQQGKRLILFIENLDQLFEHAIDDRSAATLRRLLMVDPCMMIVGTAVRQFEALQGYDQALFNYFCPVPLGRLDDKAVKDLLFRRADFDDNKQFPQQYSRHQAKIRAITQLTGGNPRLIMMLYEVLSHGEFGSAVNTLRKLVDDLTPLLKDVLEHQLSDQQRKLLDAIMRAGGTSTPANISEATRIPLNSVTRQLQRLKEMQIVEVLGGGKGHEAHYTVPDQLFCTWYKMRYLRPHRRRIEMFVEILRVWFETEERLSMLRTLVANVAGLDEKAALDTGMNIEYYAASLVGTPYEKDANELAITTWIRLGLMREAVMALAEGTDMKAKTRLEYEKTAYINFSDWALEHGNLEAAIEAAQTAVQQAPDDLVLRLRLGVALGESGDHLAAFDCFDRVLSLSPSGKEIMAVALFSRGACKEVLGDRQGALADYSSSINMEKAPKELVAIALHNRGDIKSQLGDEQGSLADFSTVIEMKGIPKSLLTQAFLSRGKVRYLLGDHKEAIADCSAVIEMEEAATEQVIMALLNRAMTKARLGDTQSAFVDYSAVIEMEEVPKELMADALIRRGRVKLQLDDVKEAMIDYSAVIEMDGATKKQIVTAFISRALSKEILDDLHGALADYSVVIEMNEVPRELVAKAWYRRGEILNLLGQTSLALESLLLSIKEPETDMDTRLFALRRAYLLASKNNGQQEMNVVAIAVKEGSANLPSEQKIAVFTRLLYLLAEPEMKNIWPDVLESLLSESPNDVKGTLEFFKPVADVLESGDLARLDPLPPEQREFAFEVLRQFEQKQLDSESEP